MGKQRKNNSYDNQFENSDLINKFLSENKFKNTTPDPMESVYRAGSKSPLIGVNTGLGDSDYDKNLNWFSHVDENDPNKSINEYRADTQSWQDHVGIGAVRTLAKATTEVLKLPGVIGGIAMSPFAAENEGFETAFNNQWIKFFDGLNEDVKEVLPVYIKESVANGDFFDKIGSSAFYATEGADGAGFMLGALAPGGLFKYFGGAAKVFGTSAKVAKLGTFSKSMEAGRKALKTLGITIKNIDQYMIPGFNTVAEAGAESKGVWDDMESRRDDAHKEYMSKLNHNDPRYQKAISLRNEEIDQLRRSGEISLEESQELYKTAHIDAAETMFEKDFKEQKALAAQNTFFKNVAVLIGPNYIQAKLLFGKTPSKVLLDKIGGLGEKSIKNTFEKSAKNLVEGFLSESAEEVSQTSITNRNIEEGLKFKLGDSRMDDYNPLTFGEDFIKTLGTTEGQVAGFLGGILGGPISAVSGHFQNVSDRKQTERLRDKINGASTAYADIKNTNIYEQEEYTNHETGEIGTRDKIVDGQKVFIPEAVAKVKKALDLIEKDSNEYDNAIEDGDVERIEQFRNQGEFNVIINFIGEDEVTLDALHEHLKVAFPTETSKDISDEQVKVNKTNIERIEKIMSKAKYLQKDLVSFKDMSTSILRINHPEITSESTKEEKESANKHLEDFLNRTAMTFLSERGEEYEAKQVLNKLEQQRLELEKDTSLIEIDNPNYIEGVSSEFDKKTKFRDNPRLDLVDSLIDKVKKQLKGYEENTNSKIWDNKYLNEQFAKEVDEINGIKKEVSPEQVAKNDEVLNRTKNAVTVDDIKEIEKTSPKDVLNNPIIKKAIADKKAEIIKAEKVANAAEIAAATQEDNDFNDTTVYTDLTGTEGSSTSDELTPKDSENNTSEEIRDINNEEVLVGKGAQVISTNMRTGELFSFVSEDYLNYERNPVNKTGKEVGFEINQLKDNNAIVKIEKRRQEELKDRFKSNLELISNKNEEVIQRNGVWGIRYKEGGPYIDFGPRKVPTQELFEIYDNINAKYDGEIKALPQNKSKVNPKVKEALDAFNRGDFSNPAFLISYLPINVTFEKDVKAPMETRRANGKLDSKKDKDGKDQFYINPATEILRTHIVNHLINGGSINDIKTTIQDQYKGLLKVDDNRFANNNILELDGVPNLKYVRDNLYVVDSFGNLKNIQTGKTKTFSNGKLKPNAKGEIYLSIPQANGKPFPLKLNIKKISESEAVLLYEVYKEIITNEKSLNTTVSEVNDDLKEAILKGFGAELNIIGGNKNDIKLQDIIDLLIYQSDNVKSQMHLAKDENGQNVLMYSNGSESKMSTKETIEEDREAITTYLINSKRHQIKINPKFATDNTKTNLKSNNVDYLTYLIDNGILTTNAAVNEPTFQGYTNIYLNTSVAIDNQSKSFGIEKRIDSIISKVFSSESLFDFSENQPGKKNKKGEFIPDNLGEQMFNAINKTIKGEVIKTDKVGAEKLFKQLAKEVHPDKHINENIKLIAEQFFKAMSIAKEKGRVDILNELKLKYDAELAALKQPKVSEQGVEVNTENTGLDEAFNAPEIGDDVLDILKEFEDEPRVENKVLDKIKGFAENSKPGLLTKKTVGNLTISQSRTSSGAIENSIFNNKEGIGYVQLITLEGNVLYAKQGNIVKLSNLNDEQVKDLVLEGADINTLLENKSETTRNSQESFVSLSEIKGTVENTQLNETQAEVFKETKSPSEMLKDAARMAPIIEKYKESLKEGGVPLSARDEARINKWAEENPEAYKKTCR